MIGIVDGWVSALGQWLGELRWLFHVKQVLLGLSIASRHPSVARTAVYVARLWFGGGADGIGQWGWGFGDWAGQEGLFLGRGVDGLVGGWGFVVPVSGTFLVVLVVGVGLGWVALGVLWGGIGCWAVRSGGGWFRWRALGAEGGFEWVGGGGVKGGGFSDAVVG